MPAVIKSYLFATPWTVAQPAPLSVGFSRQEYWSGLPLPPPGGLPDQEDYIPTPGTEDAFPGEFPLPGKEDLTPVR